MEHFSDLPDPRVHTLKSRHKLIDILVIAICAVICGADDRVSVSDFGKAKKEWLGTFLELPNGIPSHDTFDRVFSMIDPKEFEKRFIGWVQSVAEILEGEIIPIDGKTLRRSHDGAAIHMVSAWANGSRLVLG